MCAALYTGGYGGYALFAGDAGGDALYATLNTGGCEGWLCILEALEVLR